MQSKVKKIKLPLNFGAKQSFREDHNLTYDANYNRNHFTKENTKFTVGGVAAIMHVRALPEQKEMYAEKIMTQAITAITLITLLQ